MELSIDTASEMASVAVSQEGRLVAEITWLCRRNHTVELLPTVEKLLGQARIKPADITAVFVCLGPGMYTGLRVGISTAQGLAYALGIPTMGAGRLELDAYPHAAFPGPIIAVHRAGRGELAWAAYRSGPWRELRPPRLSGPEAIARAVRRRTLIVGEVDDSLAGYLREATKGRATVLTGAANLRRAASLAELAFKRLESGGGMSPTLLRPIYLRPPTVTAPGPRQ